MKMRFTLKTRSISTELTVSLFLLVLLVEGILLLIVYNRQSQFLQQELERKADIYAFNLSEVLGVPIWNIDDEQVENIGSGYTQNEILNGLYIRDSDGKTLFEFHKPQAIENHIKRYTKIAYKDQVVGSAELFVSIDKYNVDLAWLRNLIVLVLTGSLIVIFIATGFLLRVYIRRPLSVLQNGIDRVAKGDYSYKFDEIYHKELSGIANRFKEMATEIQHREISLKNEVSERKRTEASLRESERRYRSLNENIPVGVFRSKPSGEILNLNFAFLQMLDIPDVQVISQMRADDFYLRPEDRQRMLDEIDRERQVKGFECQLKKCGGDAIWVSISGRGIEDDNGRIKYIDGIVEDIHGRKMAEEAQREIRELRKRIFESSMIPIMVMDPETYAFVDCNPAAIAIYRFSSIAETLEKTPLDVSAPLQYDGSPSSAKMKYYVEKAIADGMVVFDWRHQHTDGEIWDAEVHLMRFQSEERQLLQLTIQDITERKQTEEALRRSEEQHRLLVESVPMAIGVATDDEQIEYVNPQFTALLGYHLDDIPDLKTWFQRAYPNPEYRTQVMHRWDRALAEAIAGGPATRPIEIEVTCKDGSNKSVELTGTMIGGKLYGVFSDLTERKLSEIQRKQLTSIIENSPNMVGIIDANYNIIYINPSGRKILGLGEDINLETFQIQNIHPEWVIEKSLDLYMPTAVADGTWIGESVILASDGTEIPVSQIIISHIAPTGEVDFYSTIIQDISNQKRSEAELMAYRDKLEDLVEERTSQLEKEIDERKNAERKISASLAEKEVLLREIHHRVKNNLNTVSNLLYLQSQTIEDNQITAAFQESRNRIQTMARVHELLHRSKSLARIDMDAYLKELSADLAEAFPHRSALLDTGAPDVKLEIDQAIPCGLIVTELVSNSLKYAFATDRLQNRISIELSAQGDDCRLVVADNGAGLPEGLNIDQARSLGLRLVEMLTRQLHGTFEVKSAPGQGTFFSVSFKAADPKEEE